MELVKKQIRMNRWKNHAATQLTLDDDFIVPDTMDDMEQVILDTGTVQIEAARPQGEKVMVRGIPGNPQTGFSASLPPGGGRPAGHGRLHPL